MRGGSQDMWSKSANFNRTISSVVVRFWNCLHKIYGNTSLDPIIEVLKLLAATSTLRSMSFNGYGPKPCRAKHRPLANIAKVVSLLPSFWASSLAWDKFSMHGVSYLTRCLVHSLQLFGFSVRCFHCGTYLLQAYVSTGSRSAKAATWRPESSRLHDGG